MKKLLSLAIAALAITLGGCNYSTVQPAQVGKILSTSGYEREILPPGRYTLGMRESMVLIDTSTNKYAEHMSVIMADDLTMKFDLKFRGRVDKSPVVLNPVFNDITLDKAQKITFTTLYNTYGRDQVRNAARSVVSKYKSDNVQKNFDRINAEINNELKKRFTNSPIIVSAAFLGNIQYPAAIIAANEAKAQRRIQIAEADSVNAIQLKKKQNEIELAKADRLLQNKLAETQAETNRTLSASLTPELLEAQRIEVNRIIAEGANKGQVIYMPVESLTSVGAQTKMFSGK